ncbi:MAG: rhodanese-like domain-containing protein [Mariprofundaceae bacterium]
MIRSLKSILFVLMLGLPLAVTACGVGEQSADGYENASIEHAYAHWKQGAQSPIPFSFLDVRTAKEYAQGHVPGAINIPVQELAERLNEVPKDKRVYVYCESGVRAGHASKLLVKSGITNIENVPASMKGWREAGYPIER